MIKKLFFTGIVLAIILIPTTVRVFSATNKDLYVHTQVFRAAKHSSSAVAIDSISGLSGGVAISTGEKATSTNSTDNNGGIFAFISKLAQGHSSHASTGRKGVIPGGHVVAGGGSTTGGGVIPGNPSYPGYGLDIGNGIDTGPGVTLGGGVITGNESLSDGGTTIGGGVIAGAGTTLGGGIIRGPHVKRGGRVIPSGYVIGCYDYCY